MKSSLTRRVPILVAIAVVGAGLLANSPAAHAQATCDATSPYQCISVTVDASGNMTNPTSGTVVVSGRQPDTVYPIVDVLMDPGGQAVPGRYDLEFASCSKGRAQGGVYNASSTSSTDPSPPPTQILTDNTGRFTCGYTLTFYDVYGVAGAVSQVANTIFISGNSSDFIASDLVGAPPPPPPSLSANPSRLDFGSQEVGSTSALFAVAVASTSTSNLVLGNVEVTGSDANQFAISVDSCSAHTLGYGSQCTLAVVFRPTTEGVKSATLSIPSNASSSPDTVALSGTGTPAQPHISVSPGAVDFGDQASATTSAPRSVTVTNTGGAPLSVGSTSLAGADTAAFSLVADNCSGRTLAAGAACTVTVSFAPTSQGPKSASLAIPSNAASGVATVALSGTGTPPLPADVSVSVGATPNPARRNQNLTYTVSVRNPGATGALNVSVNELLPPEVQFVSAATSQGSCASLAPGTTGTMTCSLGTLRGGTTATITVVVKVVTRKTSISDTAWVSAENPDPNSANNSATVVTAVK